jgi:hypothetical protein
MDLVRVCDGPDRRRDADVPGPCLPVRGRVGPARRLRAQPADGDRPAGPALRGVVPRPDGQPSQPDRPDPFRARADRPAAVRARPGHARRQPERPVANRLRAADRCGQGDAERRRDGRLRADQRLHDGIGQPVRMRQLLQPDQGPGGQRPDRDARHDRRAHQPRGDDPQHRGRADHGRGPDQSGQDRPEHFEDLPQRRAGRRRRRRVPGTWRGDHAGRLPGRSRLVEPPLRAVPLRGQPDRRAAPVVLQRHHDAAGRSGRLQSRRRRGAALRAGRARPLRALRRQSVDRGLCRHAARPGRLWPDVRGQFQRHERHHGRRRAWPVARARPRQCRRGPLRPADGQPLALLGHGRRSRPEDPADRGRVDGGAHADDLQHRRRLHPGAGLFRDPDERPGRPAGMLDGASGCTARPSIWTRR